MGDNENALIDLYEAKKLEPEDSKARVLLGLSLHRLKRFTESLEEYTKVEYFYTGTYFGSKFHSGSSGAWKPVCRYERL
jgi:hypothetical protein